MRCAAPVAGPGPVHAVVPTSVGARNLVSCSVAHDVPHQTFAARGLHLGLRERAAAAASRHAARRPSVPAVIGDGTPFVAYDGLPHDREPVTGCEREATAWTICERGVVQVM
ncbi:hypothetical protein GCM10023238_39420 [Streptomyces heliomycini]